MEIQLSPSNFERERGNVPELPLINMIAESVPPEGGPVLQSRPGMDVESTLVNNDPVRVLYQEAGIYSGDQFLVSGDTLFRDGVDIGDIDGSEIPSFAGFPNLLGIAAGSLVWKYDSGVLSSLTPPGGYNINKLIRAGSRIVALCRESDRFYWSDPLTLEFDTLDYATAENLDDRLYDGIHIGDTLILFGETTTEFWTKADDDDAPFVPIQGRVYNRGIKALGCVVKLGNTFAWVTNDNRVCLSDPSQTISYKGLDVEIAESLTHRLWTFYVDETELMALRLDTGTWVYSPGTGFWSKFESYGEANWEPCCYAAGIFGSGSTGRTLEWSSDHADPDTELERRFRAWGPIEGGPDIVHNLMLRLNPGQTPFLTGDNADPVIELRVSRDGGQTWSSWKPKTLGETGDYNKKVRWHGLGMFSAPGGLFEFRTTAPVPLRVTAAYINQSPGGI